MNKAIFDERSVQWIEQEMDWEEAVRNGSAPLLEQDKIESSYVEAMINNVKELGPYIIIAPDVALPHARPEDGVKEKGISVTVFQNPVWFGKEEHQQARIIICLAASDSNSHLNLLKAISAWISEDGLSSKMLNIQSKDELIQLLENYFIKGDEEL